MQADHRSPLRRHWRGALAMVGVALLVHALALGGLDWAWPAPLPASAPAAAMRVRLVTPIAAPVAEAPIAPEAPPLTLASISAPTLTPTPVLSSTPPTPAVAFMPVARAAPAPVARAMPRPAPPPAKPAVTLEPSSSVPVAVEPLVPAAAAAAPADDAIPLYATQMPPPALLRYQMQRGALVGTGELVWRPQGDRYDLLFDARVGPLPVLSQASTGGFDAAGLAPVRFTDQRARRPMQAVNFQREAGKVSFSGPATEFPLHAGVQDRLSWMVQLGAIVAADAALRVEGAKVVLRVVGSQGDASAWVFRCLGTHVVEDGMGPTDTLAYLREPRELYDTTVKVWLDPAHHHLPVRARVKSGPGDAGYTLLLQEIQPLP